MDTIRSSSVQQRTATKKMKAKKKNSATPHPVKVVYISNPMKIKTSASEFRALVQELTGQDADSSPDPARFLALHPDSSSSGSDDLSLKNIIEDNVHRVVAPLPAAVVADPNDDCGTAQQQLSIESIQSMESCFAPLDDDVFTPQMIENISAALLPASVFYESPHLSHW